MEETQGGIKLRDLSSFYQICIYICLVLIVFNLCINFVAALNVFPVNDLSTDSQIPKSSDYNETFSSVTIYPSVGNVLATLLTASGIGFFAGVALGLRMHSTVFVSIGLFTGAFWSSYYNTISIMNINGFLTSDPMIYFTVIGTTGIGIIFIAAVNSMLGGT